MTPYEQTHPNAPREESDKITAVRTSSLVCLLAGLWLFISPWAFYGMSDRRSAWNAWIVGILIFAIAGVRIVRPVYSAAFSWANVVLGLWVFFSPWIYGFSSNRTWLVNSLCVGLTVFAMSLASNRVRKMIPASDSDLEA